MADHFINPCVEGDGNPRGTWKGVPGIAEEAKAYELRTARLINEWLSELAPESGVSVDVLKRETGSQYDMYILRGGEVRSRIELEHKLKKENGWPVAKLPRRYEHPPASGNGSWDAVNILLRKLALDFLEKGPAAQSSVGYLKFNLSMTGFHYFRWSLLHSLMVEGKAPLEETLGTYESAGGNKVEDTCNRVRRMYWADIDDYMSGLAPGEAPEWIATDEHYGVTEFSADADCSAARRAMIEELVRLAQGTAISDPHYNAYVQFRAEQDSKDPEEREREERDYFDGVF